MTKFDWTKAKKLKKPALTEKAWKRRFGPKPDPDEEIIIVRGEDTTKSGEREVHIFPNLKAAHKAGFIWAI